jgi:phosphatidylglycerol:prolipoprotein diacylglycerol transferase
MLVLTFPVIDPVAIAFGPLAIRWYSLAYIVGLIFGWRFMMHLAGRPPGLVARQDCDDFMIWATLGVILGGRLGYAIFYQPLYFLYNPVEILAVWRGGMSFHGGMLGVMFAAILFTRKRNISGLAFCDLVCTVAPVGLFFGRIANFINGELVGRVTDVPWAMVFPRGGPDPRHPSQLYEATLEGLVLFAVLLFLVYRIRAMERPGFLSGAFLVGYAVARGVVELVREPDAQLGFLIGGATMGQLLSVPLALGGLYLIWRARRQP